MTTFTVEWTLEVDAVSPEEAARAAYQRILARAHLPAFDVYTDDPDEGDGYHHHQIILDVAGEPTRRPAPSRWQAELDAVCAEIDAEAFDPVQDMHS